MILGHMIFDSSVNAYVVNDYVIKPGDLIYVHFTSPRGKLTVIPTQMILDYRHQ